jgi:hypothetical protein
MGLFVFISREALLATSKEKLIERSKTSQCDEPVLQSRGSQPGNKYRICISYSLSWILHRFAGTGGKGQKKEKAGRGGREKHHISGVTVSEAGPRLWPASLTANR